VNSAFIDYFRCPESLATFGASGTLSEHAGYFTFGGSICYARLAGAAPSPQIDGAMPDAQATQTSSGPCLPFDLTEVATNLREERYPLPAGQGLVGRLVETSAFTNIYYHFRPRLPVHVRKHLQRARLSGWQQILFPQWPVDCTIEKVMQSVMALMIEKSERRRIPFIWFWPDGAPSCTIVTHDVEEAEGRAFCPQLMDLDDSFDVKSAFQIVPEMADGSLAACADAIRARGFEVNLHDLNHDGRLFRDHAEFLVRAAQINQYAKDVGCEGFRSGAMYREQEWFEALDFAYDMSVPSVAHLEPQRGGCCTVMPYFIGKILELPLTTTQDYSLFHILDEYSISLWKEQIELILGANGLISFIAHPDYLVEARARAVYVELLTHLSKMRDAGATWLALPGDVNRWWRERSAMRIVCSGGEWRIEGAGSERARLAYAVLDGGQVSYEYA
jgi:hypothetical protein